MEIVIVILGLTVIAVNVGFYVSAYKLLKKCIKTAIVEAREIK